MEQRCRYPQTGNVIVPEDAHDFLRALRCGVQGVDERCCGKHGVMTSSRDAPGTA
jgi:hypothetical protein